MPPCVLETYVGVIASAKSVWYPAIQRPEQLSLEVPPCVVKDINSGCDDEVEQLEHVGSTPLR